MKSQSTMEYLMTYGWAILIIAVILGVLFQLGVFGSGTFLGSSCIAGSGFLCSNPVLNSYGQLQITFGQATGLPLILTGIGCSNTTTVPASFTPVPSLTMQSGAENISTVFTCSVRSGTLGTPFTGTLWITYTQSAHPGLISQIGTISTLVKTNAWFNSGLCPQSTGNLCVLSFTPCETSTSFTIQNPLAGADIIVGVTGLTSSTTIGAPTVTIDGASASLIACGSGCGNQASGVTYMYTDAIGAPGAPSGTHTVAVSLAGSNIVDPEMFAIVVSNAMYNPPYSTSSGDTESVSGPITTGNFVDSVGNFLTLDVWVANTLLGASGTASWTTTPSSYGTVQDLDSCHNSAGLDSALAVGVAFTTPGNVMESVVDSASSAYYSNLDYWNIV